MKKEIKPYLLLALAYAVLFLIGVTAGKVISTVGHNTKVITNSSQNWGLGFGSEGQQPTGNATPDEMKKYDAYYVGNNNDKVIYLTFDCGYENGNTEPILAALKKHNVSATFFVVGHFLETSPDIVKKMVAEGHTVGNHTYHHRDMGAISAQSEFEDEMNSVEKLYEEITGQKISKFYRPPQGKYCLENLKMAKSLGYKTFFWSLAYVDWKVDAQPSKEEAYRRLLGRIHPGAIVLLHSTSKTNGEILDELLTKWEEMGYTFKPLSSLASPNDSTASPVPIEDKIVY